MKQPENAQSPVARGRGSFVPHFLDALWRLTQEVQA
ncbi:hypothetical protein OIU92_00420 [Escherichia coli]|nr:hypothetical protein [Escherichia coli]